MSYSTMDAILNSTENGRNKLDHNKTVAVHFSILVSHLTVFIIPF